MDNANKKRATQLEQPFGTACNRLRKSIMFNLLVRHNENVCHKCSKPIEKIEELSIEHKTPWLDSKNPKELFFDLSNIAFSHLFCNVKSARRSFSKTKEYRENHSRITCPEFIGPEGTAWCGICRGFLPKENFSVNNQTRSKTEWMCRSCRKIHRSK